MVAESFARTKDRGLLLIAEDGTIALMNRRASDFLGLASPNVAYRRLQAFLADESLLPRLVPSSSGPHVCELMQDKGGRIAALISSERTEHGIIITLDGALGK